MRPKIALRRTLILIFLIFFSSLGIVQPSQARLCKRAISQKVFNKFYSQKTVAEILVEFQKMFEEHKDEGSYYKENYTKESTDPKQGSYNRKDVESS